MDNSSTNNGTNNNVDGDVLVMHNHCRSRPLLTKFEGGLNLLHEADDDAVIWLESTATAALAKQ